LAQADLEELKKRFNAINHQITEIHQTMATKEALDLSVRNIMTRLDAIDKRIDDWRDATKTYFVVLGIIIAAVPILVSVVSKMTP